jgi:hypothetical protein
MQIDTSLIKSQIFLGGRPGMRFETSRKSFSFITYCDPSFSAGNLPSLINWCTRQTVTPNFSDTSRTLRSFIVERLAERIRSDTWLNSSLLLNSTKTCRV